MEGHGVFRNSFDLNIIEIINATKVPFKGLILIASDIKIKNEIIELCSKAGYLNMIHVSELYYIINDFRVKRYMEYFEKNRPLFKDIEIETINRCNGICGFCPVNKNEKQRPYHKMTEELFYSIIDQLAEISYNRQVALFSNNELFIDDRIICFAEYTRKKLPDAWINLYTNGTLLTEEIKRIERIAKEENWDEKTIIATIKADAIRSSRAGNAPNSKVYATVDNPCILPWV